MRMSGYAQDFYMFLLAYRDSVKNGTTTEIFPSAGLCHNYTTYWKNGLRKRDCARGDFIHKVLKAEFADNWSIPFNDTLQAFRIESEEHTGHLNPKRLAWVNKKIRRGIRAIEYLWES